MRYVTASLAVLSLAAAVAVLKAQAGPAPEAPRSFTGAAPSAAPAWARGAPTGYTYMPGFETNYTISLSELSEGEAAKIRAALAAAEEGASGLAAAAELFEEAGFRLPADQLRQHAEAAKGHAAIVATTLDSREESLVRRRSELEARKAELESEMGTVEEELGRTQDGRRLPEGRSQPASPAMK